MPAERFVELERLMIQAKSTQEFEEALDRFKNGKEHLKRLERI